MVVIGLCTVCADRRQPSIREMEEIAWVLRSDPTRKEIGFVRSVLPASPRALADRPVAWTVSVLDAAAVRPTLALTTDRHVRQMGFEMLPAARRKPARRRP